MGIGETRTSARLRTLVQKGAHAEAQEEQFWTCQNCTLQNPRDYLACAACGQLESVPEDGWRCKDCQENNAAWATKCKCGGERYLREGGGDVIDANKL